jgi:hypothetical protein
MRRLKVFVNQTWKEAWKISRLLDLKFWLPVFPGTTAALTRQLFDLFEAPNAQLPVRVLVLHRFPRSI